MLLQDTFLYKFHIIFIESDHISQIQKKKKKMEQEENGVWEKMLVDMKKVT